MSLKESRNNPVKPGSGGSGFGRRGGAVRGGDQCLVAVGPARQITGLNPTVTLERKDEHKHLYSLETSFMVKSPSMCRSW